MVCMRQRHLQQVSRRDVYTTTCKMLLLLYCILTSHLSQSDCMMQTLKFYTVPVRMDDVKNF